MDIHGQMRSEYTSSIVREEGHDLVRDAEVESEVKVK